MGGACCVRTETIPEEYILSIYSSLKLRNYSFQVLYEQIMNKNFNSKNLMNLSNEKFHFIDFKRIVECIFYDQKNTDEVYFKLHKHIFEQLVFFYTKPNGEISLVEIFTLLLLLVDNTNIEKAKYFYEMHIMDFDNATKFKITLLTYLKDCLLLLSNYCDEINDHHETPETLHYYLSSFTQLKIEKYFESYLHKDLVTLSGESQKLIDLVNEINFIFNFNKLRESYHFYFKEERISDFNTESIKRELDIYTITRKKSR